MDPGCDVLDDRSDEQLIEPLVKVEDEPTVKEQFSGEIGTLIKPGSCGEF